MIARIWQGVVQTGDDIEAAVLYPEDARYLVGGESTVTHYQVIDQVSA